MNLQVENPIPECMPKQLIKPVQNRTSKLRAEAAQLAKEAAEQAKEMAE